MAKRYRFTGEWPHPNLISMVPNWEHALDEEHLPDQDETTIRPAANQRLIDTDIPFAGADAWLADGRFCSGILELLDDIAGYNVNIDGVWFRLICTDGRWDTYVESWLPLADRRPSLDLADTTIFPLKLASCVPLSATGSQIKLVIHPDGAETAW